MKNLKCESCGGLLEIDDKNEYAYCNYCGSRYKVNEDVNLKIKLELDENFHKSLNTGLKIFEKVSVSMVIAMVVTFVVFAIIFVTIFFNIFKSFSKTDDVVQSTISEVDKMSFNGVFELYSGTKHIMHVKALIDEINTNNKTTSIRKITVVYNDIEYVNNDELIELKSILTSDQYEVSLSYNEKGLVNRADIMDVK